MFFRISINFYQFSLTITFDATKHYYMPTSQIFTTFMGVSCKSFFLSLVVLHILLNQNVAILYSSLKMSFCHFPVFHARCSFYYYNLQFFCFFLFFLSLSSVHPFKFFFSAIILCILNPDCYGCIHLLLVWLLILDCQPRFSQSFI